MKSRILITGGSGFIGTNLIEYFLEKNYDVKNIDICEPKIEARRDIWKKLTYAIIQNWKRLSVIIIQSI